MGDQHHADEGFPAHAGMARRDNRPTLASFFKALGFVQTFGLGIPLARRACADNQNPPPEFAFQPGTFGAIVRKRG